MWGLAAETLLLSMWCRYEVPSLGTWQTRAGRVGRQVPSAGKQAGRLADWQTGRLAGAKGCPVLEGTLILSVRAQVGTIRRQ